MIDRQAIAKLQAAMVKAETEIADDTDYPLACVVMNGTVGRILSAATEVIASTQTADFRETPNADDSGWNRIPVTMVSLTRILPMYRSPIVHGEDANGVVDIEFCDASTALGFMGSNLGWITRLRDAITDPCAPCVVQIKLDGYAPGVNPCWEPINDAHPATGGWHLTGEGSDDTVFGVVERRDGRWQACDANGSALDVPTTATRNESMRYVERHATGRPYTD